MWRCKEATPKTSSLSGTGGGGGGGNYPNAYVSKTAYRMHLGPSPFDSEPQTLRDMRFSFLGELLRHSCESR